MADNLKRSILHSHAIEKNVQLDNDFISDAALPVFQSTIEAMRTLLLDPEPNQVEAFTAEFLDDVLRQDIATIIQKLDNYQGEQINTDEIEIMVGILEDAETELSVIAKFTRMESLTMSEELERGKMLKSVRRNLKKSIEFLALFTSIIAIF